VIKKLCHLFFEPEVVPPAVICTTDAKNGKYTTNERKQKQKT